MLKIALKFAAYLLHAWVLNLLWKANVILTVKPCASTVNQSLTNKKPKIEINGLPLSTGENNSRLNTSAFLWCGYQPFVAGIACFKSLVVYSQDREIELQSGFEKVLPAPKRKSAACTRVCNYKYSNTSDNETYHFAWHLPPLLQSGDVE